MASNTFDLNLVVLKKYYRQRSIEKRILRYGKIVISHSFLLRFGPGYRRFIRRKVIDIFLLSMNSHLHRRRFISSSFRTL